jgi:hypothetical protein
MIEQGFLELSGNNHIIICCYRTLRAGNKRVSGPFVVKRYFE